MTTQPAHENPQRDRTRDLFAAFATHVAGKPEDVFPRDAIEHGMVQVVLWALTDIRDPMSGHVLNAIHAERRRRMSAATREERRGC